MDFPQALQGREGGLKEGGRKEGHQFTGHSSLFVGGKNKCEVLCLGLYSCIAGTSEKGCQAPTEGSRLPEGHQFTGIASLV